MASRYYAINNELIMHNSFKTKVGPAQPKPIKGSKLIIFEKDLSRKEMFFLGTSEVLETEKFEKEDEIFLIVKIDEPREFDEPRDLLVLAGSLRKVYRFLQPHLHFQRKIVALDKYDFQTIVNNEIDLSRSIFQYIFSSLPLNIKGEFMRIHSEKMSLTAKGTIADYNNILDVLINFIEERVASVFELFCDMASTHEDLQNKSPNIPKLKTLTLAKGDTKMEIPFGIVAKSVSDFLHTNQIFRRKGIEKLLLEETELAIGDLEDYKKWDDQIF